MKAILGLLVLPFIAIGALSCCIWIALQAGWGLPEKWFLED